MANRYKLATGTQVRNEAFGLLFYTQAGPRLYFLTSGEFLPSTFFGGQLTLSQCLGSGGGKTGALAGRIRSLENALTDLCQRGVINEI